MPIKPSATVLSYTSTGIGSGYLYVNEITGTNAVQPFQRLEFSNPKLRSAPTSTGALPLIVQSFGNQPIQLLTTCTGDVPRPLGPDDANISNIRQKFNITRWQIRGAANSVNDIQNQLQNTFYNHLALLNKFDTYLAELQMELSIGYLTTTLQALTFSYLTSTGLSLSGNALGFGTSGATTINNLLMTAFEYGVEYEAPIPGTANSTVLQDFSMTVEQRTIASESI